MVGYCSYIQYLRVRPSCVRSADPESHQKDDGISQRIENKDTVSLSFSIDCIDIIEGVLAFIVTIVIMASAAALKDYAPAAASLFNNMKTPASILAGAMIPLGFLSPLPQPPAHVKAVPPTKKRGKQTEESDLAIAITKSLDRSLRKSYLLVTLFSFGSELLAVIWSTVAVNQLTETVIPPAESVWALLQRDWYDLAWSATNSHFLFGMLGFMWMVGTRAYLMVQAKPWNINPVSAGDEANSNTMSIASILMVASSFLLMISIVNRGVANVSIGIHNNLPLQFLTTYYYF